MKVSNILIISLFFSSYCTCITSVKIISSQPKVIYTNTIVIDNIEQEFKLLAGEEPVDIIQTFSQPFNLDFNAKKLILEHVCNDIPCRRYETQTPIVLIPASWIAQETKEFCSLRLIVVEADLFDLHSFISHHCDLLASKFPGCLCTKLLKLDLFRQISASSQSFIWSEYSQPHVRLGVKQNATEREIKRAFRRLSKLFHPDRNHFRSDFGVENKHVENKTDEQNNIHKEGAVNNTEQEKYDASKDIYKGKDFSRHFMLLNDAYDKMIQKLHVPDPNNFNIISGESIDDEFYEVVLGEFVFTLKKDIKVVQDQFGQIQFVQL